MGKCNIHIDQLSESELEIIMALRKHQKPATALTMFFGAISDYLESIGVSPEPSSDAPEGADEAV